MGDVGGDVAEAEGLEVVGDGDALGELAQLVLLQQVVQLGLADEDQVQQVVLLGVDVGEHADLFQALDAEVLRLVDDQHHRVAGGVLADQELDEIVVELDLGLAFVLQAIGHHDPLGHFAEVVVGEVDQPDTQLRPDLVEQAIDERGLAAAHLAGDDGEALAVLDAVLEQRQRRGVALRHVEERGIGQQREGAFLEAVEVLVHPVDRPRCAAAPTGWRARRAAGRSRSRPSAPGPC